MLQSFIYGLKDPRNGAVRYVGKSATGFRRPLSHLDEAKSGSPTHKSRWIRQLLKAGLEYEIVVLERNPVDPNEAEKRWIVIVRKQSRLTNSTQGGDGGRISEEAMRRKVRSTKLFYETHPGPMTGRRHSPETRGKMRQAALRRIARGDSPVCDPEHQRRAGKSSRKNDTPEQRRKADAHCRRIARAGAEARWGTR